MPKTKTRRTTPALYMGISPCCDEGTRKTPRGSNPGESSICRTGLSLFTQDFLHLGPVSPHAFVTGSFGFHPGDGLVTPLAGLVRIAQLPVGHGQKEWIAPFDVACTQ